MDFTKYENKGLTGLTNLGNTCFMNSCLQILSHTYEFNDFLNEGKYQRKLQKKFESALILEWDDLRKMMWSENCVISPGKFLKTVQKLAQIKQMDIFTGFSQNDVPEFLLFVIDCFHTSLSREVTMNIQGEAVNMTDKIALSCFEMIQRTYTKEYSEIWKLFYGIHVSQLISLDGSNEILSSSPEPYFMIDLPLPENIKEPTLYNCFDSYVEGETMDGDNAWLNEKTGKKEDVKKKLSFWSFPQILVIDLKRFKNKVVKNQTFVTFPLEELNLSKYSIGYKKNSFVYDLYGVSNHSGGVLGGHYTSFVKNANGKWYHYNDTSVSEVNPSQVISQKAYCLFYRKRIIV